jgi:hypothetical protein
VKGVLSLNDRLSMTAQTGPTDRILNAHQFAEEICGGHVSAKYVIKHFRDVGSKPGKEWLWYESIARAAWTKRMPKKRVA